MNPRRLAVVLLIAIATAFALWKIALIEAPPLHCPDDLARLCADLRP